MCDRLSRPGVRGTDEGNFIHLALGCVGNYWMGLDGTNKDGDLVDASRSMVVVQIKNI